MASPMNAVVWAEIPVSDLKASMAFYAQVLGNELTLNPMAPIPMADFAYDGGVAGHLYEGAPGKGAGPTVHLAIPGSVEEAISAVRGAGGEAEDMIVEIPPGRFAIAQDLDGNRIGLFEPKAA